MQEKYLPYYKNFTFYAPLVFLWGSLFTHSNIKRWSLMNRQKDYVRLADNSRLMTLHRELNNYLLESQENWKSHDYGEGYFYQGLDLIGVSGLRDTQGRVEAMGLKDILQGKTVIEIGCNTGFLSISVAKEVKRIVGFDINPHLIDIGKAAARYLNYTNVELLVSSFEEYGDSEPADSILSFANHATYDGNTKQSIEEYFDRCLNLIKPGGMLLFESHPPSYEGEALEGVCAIIEKKFKVLERRTLDYGNFLDRGRTFIIARRE